MTSRVTTFIKEKKTIIIVLAILFFIFVINFLFRNNPIHYDDLEFTAIEKNGRFEFEYYFTDRGGFTTGGPSNRVIDDYDNGVCYRYYYVSIYANRWDIWFHRGKYSLYDFILDKNGHEIHHGKEDPNEYTKEEYIENPDWLSSRYIRLYYINPDGTLVLIWEHPDAQNIIERTQAELEPPESYIVKVRR